MTRTTPRNAVRIVLAALLMLLGRPAFSDEPLSSINLPLEELTRIGLQDELLQIWQSRRVTMILVTHDVEEAIYPGDRVLVMQPHPGRITGEIPLDLPRPRDRASARFTELRRQILHDMDAFSALAA